MTHDTAKDCLDSYTEACFALADICKHGWRCPSLDNGALCVRRGRCLEAMRCIDNGKSLGRDCFQAGGHCTNRLCVRGCVKIQKPEHISAVVARVMESWENKDA
jgi:hypothetical protein